jgi:hypothetical protein
MGNQTGRPAIGSRSRRAMELLGRLLEPGDRDAVLGDLAEAEANPPRALFELSGLIIRRHLERWRDWRPWLAVVAIVVPVGATLGHVARWWADVDAIYAWAYVNNWTGAHLNSTGARTELLHHTTRFLLHCLTLAAWSLTAGAALRLIARRTVSVLGPLFCLTVVFATLGTMTTARANAANTAIFSTLTYDALFPWTLRIVLVMAPAILGMRADLTGRSRRLTIATAVMVVALTAWNARQLEASLVFGRGDLPSDPGADRVTGTADDARTWAWLPLVMAWPAGLVAAAAARQGRRPDDVLREPSLG